MVEYGKALSRGLSFGIKPKRWLQLFILDIIFISIGLAIVLPNLPEIISILATSNQDFTMFLPFIGVAASVFAVFIVWILVRLWFTGAIVHQSYKEKDKISNSYRIAGRKYGHLFLATLIVTIILMAVNMIPYVGWVIAIILSWVFFFIVQGIMVSNMGFAKTIENSYHIFRKNPPQVFLAWLFIAIVTFVIYIIFSIPAMFLMFGMFASLIPMFTGTTLPQSEALASLSQVIQTNMLALIVVGIILLVGMSIAQIFALKAQTEFYLQLKKKKL